MTTTPSHPETPETNAAVPDAALPGAVTPEQFDTLDTILDDMRTRYDETPQWEFCEGYMAALICCRRAIPQAEYLDVLLAIGEAGDDVPVVLQEGQNSPDLGGSFADEAQRASFLQIWDQRWAEVQTALDTPIESLEDAHAYHPEVMDVRGAMAELSDAERAELSD